MDIVERLRRYRPTYGWPEERSVIVEPTLNHVAADEIERLREALQKISAVEDEHINPPTTPAEANLWCIIDGCVRVAEKALGLKER